MKKNVLHKKKGNPLIKLFIFLIRAYQVCLGPWTQGGCRLHPSCSNYAIEALQKRGALRGLYLTFRRILRCNPYGASGKDPVPDK